MSIRIPLSVPNLTQLEADAVSQCVASGWVSSAGPQLREFADACAQWAGRAHAVPVVNGTAALHLALLAVGVQPGDLVLVPDLTFIASANAVAHAGASPVLVDVDARSWQMDAGLVREFLEKECSHTAAAVTHKATGRKVSAILVVDVLGHLPAMDEFLALSGQVGIPLVEDAAESLGSKLDGRRAGSFGRVSTFSFNGNKIITTGGGGMVLTDDPALAERVRHLSTQAKSDPQEYAHDAVGYNYRMTALNAALGIAQLGRLEGFLQRKREVFEFYNEAFAALPQVCPFRPVAAGLDPNHWLYTVAAEESRGLQKHLANLSIETRKLWQPLHRQKPYAASLLLGDGHAAEQAYEGSLSLPCSTSITDAELEEVALAVKAYYR